MTNSAKNFSLESLGNSMEMIAELCRQRHESSIDNKMHKIETGKCIQIVKLELA